MNLIILKSNLINNENHFILDQFFLFLLIFKNYINTCIKLVQ